MNDRSASARAAFGVSLLLAALCAVPGAQAQTPTMPFPGRYENAVEIRGYPGDNSCLQLYTPPAPYSLAVTDLSLDSYGSTTPIAYQYICTGKPVCSAARSSYMTAPAGNTMVQNWSTAMIVKAGDTLSVCNYGGIGKITSWTFHGVLFTPSTASNVANNAFSASPQQGMPQPTPPKPERR